MNKAILVQGGDGTAVPAGMVGNYQISSNDSVSIASGTTRNTGTLTLTPGVYIVWATSGTDFANNNPNITKIEISLSTTSATHNATYKSTYSMPATAASSFGRLASSMFVLTVAATTTWYGVTTVTASGTYDNLGTSLNAVRIA